MSKRKSGKRIKKVPVREPRIVEHVPDGDDDDEEISEDEAFNSEDERMYGHLFHRENQGEDAQSSEDELVEDDEDDSDGGQYMLGLLDKLGNSDEESKPKNHKEKLTLEKLMEGLDDTQGYNELRKSLIKDRKAAPAPIEKTYADRVQRNLTYTEQVNNLSGWTKVIQENRQAETLDFKPKDRIEVTKDSLITVFEPKSEFENDLQKALEQAGQDDEEAIFRQEERALQDDLGSNRLSMDEYKQRRRQLAQIRALMFYHEQKRHHMKKIKSKKYRRIRKKQRQRVRDSILEAAMQEDESLANEMKQKEEISRIQERMTLAHKNTSKWAKRILKRGKNVDVDTRKALSAQLKRGDDLRRKIIDNDDESASDGMSDGEDLVKSTQDILTDVQTKDLDQNERHGLFKLSFMKKGIQKQRDLAKEEARKLLVELKASEIEEDGEKRGIPSGKTASEEKVASPQEMKNHLTDGELMAKSREFGVSNSLVSSGPIDILQDKELGQKEPFPTTTKPRIEEKESNLQSKKESDNPWIGSIEHNGSASFPVKVNKGSESLKAKKTEEILDLDAVVKIMDDNSRIPKSSSAAESMGLEKGRITSMNQEELVRRAFATTEMKEISADFEQELKDTVAVKPRKDADTKASCGWGSWAGIGAPPPRQSKRDRKQLSSKKEPNSSSQGKRSASATQDVIVNKKRLKKASDMYMLGELPHPFSSREEYEQVMLGGIGKEWNVASAYRNMTRPEILTRSGKSIRPISKSAKLKRAAAKF